MPSTDRRRVPRWVVWTLVVVGLACLAWSGFAAFQLNRYQRAERARLTAARVETAPVEPASPAPSAPLPPGDSSTPASIGILEIPRLHFSQVVAEGDAETTLKIAIGHLPDTPLPWQMGNSALAGHRNALFEPLRDIKVGDDMRIATPRGDFAYRVRATMIVNPEDVWILTPTRDRTLTLVTCYPFTYVGHAPQRFVVSADEIPPRQTASRR
ncbi:MAG: class D sortase [Acidobacteriota bacterium]